MVRKYTKLYAPTKSIRLKKLSRHKEKMKKEFNDIISKFEIKGKLVSCERYGEGHIKLIEDMEKPLPEMEKIVKKY